MRRISSICSKVKQHKTAEPNVEWKWEMYPTLIFYDHLRGTQFEPHLPLMKKYNEMFPINSNNETIEPSTKTYEFESIEDVEGHGNLILKKWLEKVD